MNRIELVRTEIDLILQHQPDIDERRNGFVHLYGVTQNCTLLAIKRGLNVELCTIMGMLHDIYTYKCCYVKEHAMLGANVAENLLKELNLFTDDEIEIVRNSIFNHSDKKTKHDKYSELLKDADVLQNSLYNIPMEVSHRKRFKKTLKELGIKIKRKKKTLKTIECT
ncbi:MAG: HD domain-containing protein [Paludibacter sp.]